MSVFVTREEIITLGSRVASEKVVAEIDRMLPIATTDARVLEAGGYTAVLLEQLRGHRAQLTAETAERRAQRGQKKGARQVETAAVTDGKRVLRAAIAMAEVATQHRVPPEGETPEETRTIATELVAALHAAGGHIGHDSAKLRTRLTAVASVLESAAIAPDEPGRPAREAMLVRVRAAAAALPSLAEQKKAAQQQARANTEALDEIDGHAYLNLKSLMKVGRTQWIARGDATRASEYQFVELRDVPARPAKPETPPT